MKPTKKPRVVEEGWIIRRLWQGQEWPVGERHYRRIDRSEADAWKHFRMGQKMSEKEFAEVKEQGWYAARVRLVKFVEAKRGE